MFRHDQARSDMLIVSRLHPDGYNFDDHRIHLDQDDVSSDSTYQAGCMTSCLKIDFTELSIAGMGTSEGGYITDRK
jgi:hypothetical protein